MSNAAIVVLNDETGKYDAVFNGERIASAKKPAWLKRNLKTNKRAKELNVTRWEFGKGQVSPTKSTKSTPVAVQQSRFEITERFDFMSEAVKMVLDGINASVVISGQGGLGKTHAVLAELTKREMVEDHSVDGTPGTDYIIVKGVSTPKGLFRLLQLHNNKLIFFDDTDSVLKNADSAGLLKAALDSYGDRWITWNAESKDDLERSFKFTGKVIFVTNLHESKLEQSLVSRSMVIDLSMTTEDIINRMKGILHSLDLPANVTSEHREDAMAFVEQRADDIRDLNIRTLMKVAKIRANISTKKWEKMADYIAVGG